MFLETPYFQKIEPGFTKFDRYVDYTPLAPLTNGIHLGAAFVYGFSLLTCLPLVACLPYSESIIGTYTKCLLHVTKKGGLRTVTLLVPIVGSIVVIVLDKKAWEKMEEAQTSYKEAEQLCILGENKKKIDITFDTDKEYQEAYPKIENAKSCMESIEKMYLCDSILFENKDIINDNAIIDLRFRIVKLKALKSDEVLEVEWKMSKKRVEATNNKLKIIEKENETREWLSKSSWANENLRK